MVDSWDGKRAHDYRSAARISDELEATVNVMGMVFGNFEADAATGVAMPRNATEGERNSRVTFSSTRGVKMWSLVCARPADRRTRHRHARDRR